MDNWNFKGTLSENGNRVITEAEGFIEVTKNSDIKNGKITTSVEDGKLNIKITLPFLSEENIFEHINSECSGLKTELMTVIETISNNLEEELVRINNTLTEEIGDLKTALENLNTRVTALENK